MKQDNKDFIERMNFADCLGKEYQKMLIPKVESLFFFFFTKGEKTVLFLRALSMTTIGQIKKNNRFIVNKLLKILYKKDLPHGKK